MDRRRMLNLLTTLLEELGISDYSTRWMEQKDSWMIRLDFPSRFEKFQSSDLEGLDEKEIRNTVRARLERVKQQELSDGSSIMGGNQTTVRSGA